MYSPLFLKRSLMTFCPFHLVFLLVVLNEIWAHYTLQMPVRAITGLTSWTVQTQMGECCRSVGAVGSYCKAQTMQLSSLHLNGFDFSLRQLNFRYSHIITCWINNLTKECWRWTAWWAARLLLNPRSCVFNTYLNAATQSTDCKQSVRICSWLPARSWALECEAEMSLVYLEPHAVGGWPDPRCLSGFVFSWPDEGTTQGRCSDALSSSPVV